MGRQCERPEHKLYFEIKCRKFCKDLDFTQYFMFLVIYIFYPTAINYHVNTWFEKMMQNGFHWNQANFVFFFKKKNIFID